MKTGWRIELAAMRLRRLCRPRTGGVVGHGRGEHLPGQDFVTPKDRLIPLSAIRSELESVGCAQRRRQIAGGPAAGATPSTTGDAGAGGLLQWGGELHAIWPGARSTRQSA